MKGIAWIVIVGLAASTPWAQPAQAEDAPPAWAYVVNPPDFKPEPDDGKLRHVPDSAAAFTMTQAHDLFFALDCTRVITRRCRILSLTGASPM